MIRPRNILAAAGLGLLLGIAPFVAHAADLQGSQAPSLTQDDLYSFEQAAGDTGLPAGYDRVLLVRPEYQQQANRLLAARSASPTPGAAEQTARR